MNLVPDTLRFVPDSWLDGVLRPWLMADPVNGMYIEIAAPDVRFAALFVLLVWLAWRRRLAIGLTSTQSQALLSFIVCFYIWTGLTGNGRYYVWGLALIGPLLSMVVHRLPGILAARNTTLIGILLLQGLGIWAHFVPNVWSLRPWREGPGFALQASPLRETPAVFLTVGSISYSALVPQMHPSSRWANMTGQVTLRPGLFEYPDFRKLLLSDQPKYLVVRANGLVMGLDRQPAPKVWQSIDGVLARQGLALKERRCAYLRSGDAEKAFARNATNAVEEGFWFCPLVLARQPSPVNSLTPQLPVAPEMDEVFAQVEQRCPRIFTPGRARSVPIDGAVQRAYSLSDTSLYVDNSGLVYFKNTRALNPTPIGTIEQVRHGRFDLDCTRIPGRYIPPWARS